MIVSPSTDPTAVPSPTKAQLDTLRAQAEAPCVSLYQPTHRTFPDTQQDPIRFRNLVRGAEASLAALGDTDGHAALLAPLHALLEDDAFWRRRTEGLACFASPGRFELFDLVRPVPERVVVADSFHVKPLHRIVQSAERFMVLALDRAHARLYEGDRDALHEVTITAFPTTLTDALGDQVTEEHVYGSVPVGGAGRMQGQGSIGHGQGQRKDEIDVDVERFFRIIARGVLDTYSRPTQLPLILCALAEYHTPFRGIIQNPQLLEQGIAHNPATYDLDGLRAAAWTVMEPYFLERLAGHVERFGTARAHELGSDDPDAVALAALGGRVGTMLVEAERVIPGRIDRETGRIVPGDLADPHVDDVLDDLAELTLDMGGEVVVVPAARMPVPSGVAAIYRF